MPEQENQATPREQRILQLQMIADAWALQDIVPEEARALTKAEFAAVALTACRSSALMEPVTAFLLMDGWLQEWVMTRLGLWCFVGMPIGVSQEEV